MIWTILNSPSKPLTNENGPSDRWWMLTFVAFAYFILVLHRKLVFYVQVPLIEELTLTDTELGWLDTVFIVPYGISQLFVSYLSDHFRRRTVLMYSMALSAGGLAVMGLVRNFEELLSLRIILGFAQAASVPAIAGVLADCFTHENRSRAIAIYNISLNLAYIVAGKFGGRLADMHPIDLPPGFVSTSLSGWRVAMLCFAFLGILWALAICLFMREPERTERDPNHGLGTEGASLWQTLCSVLAVPSFWVLAAVFILVCIVVNGQDVWLVRYFTDNFEMNNEEAGQFSTVWKFPFTVVGLILGGVLADRWAQRWRSGRTLVQVIGMVIWVPSIYFLCTSDSENVARMAMVVIGFGNGLYLANLWTTTFEVIDPAARSTAIGMLNVIGVGASPVGPIIGYLNDRQILDLGQSLAGMSLFAAMVVALLLLNVTVLLRNDYRGPLAKESSA